MNRTKWINVRTSKPPIDTEILVFQRFRHGTHIKIAEYVRPFGRGRPVFSVNISREKNGDVYSGYPLNGITHWMPLPEPPTHRKTKIVLKED